MKLLMELHFDYKTDPRVCSDSISFDYIDGKIYHVRIKAGCIGSNLALCRLAEGLWAEEVIDRCAGVNCNGIGTSCPDQLAKAVQSCLEKLKI